jgi:hypothetical protein
MRRPWPTLGCSTRRRKKHNYVLSHFTIKRLAVQLNIQDLYKLPKVSMYTSHQHDFLKIIFLIFLIGILKIDWRKETVLFKQSIIDCYRNRSHKIWRTVKYHGHRNQRNVRSFAIPLVFKLCSEKHLHGFPQPHILLNETVKKHSDTFLEFSIFLNIFNHNRY